MNSFTRTMIGLGVAVPMMISGAIAAEAWETDLEAGLKAAKAKNRPVLVEFTGSDWCPPCKMLKKVNLNTPEFEKFAAENELVLVELDYPKAPGVIPKELMDKRVAIMQKYSVDGFPTVLIMNAEGETFARIVSFRREVSEYLKLLKDGIDAKVQLEKDVAAASKLNGDAKASALNEALKKLPKTEHGFHKSLIGEISKLDTNDTFGYGKKLKEVEMMAAQVKAFEDLATKYRGKIAKADVEAYRNDINKKLENKELLPPIRQGYYKVISDLYAIDGDLNKTAEYLKKAIDVCPNTKEGKKMQGWYDHLINVVIPNSKPKK